MTDWQQLTWSIARAGGLTAYALLSVSVAIGLTLSLGWRSRIWPRFLTREVHQFTTLLALAFTAVHGLALWFDPFTRFGLAELLLPLASHYRPIWMALGIVAGYLAGALFLTEYVRPLIGFAWWLRLHRLTFVAYALATAHGITTGSDTRTAWSFLLYASSVSVAVTLLLFRLVEARRPGPGARAALGIGVVGLVLAGWFLAAMGPLHVGWNDIANLGQGTGSRVP